MKEMREAVSAALFMTVFFQEKKCVSASKEYLLKQRNLAVQRLRGRIIAEGFFIDSVTKASHKFPEAFREAATYVDWLSPDENWVNYNILSNITTEDEAALRFVIRKGIRDEPLL